MLITVHDCGKDNDDQDHDYKAEDAVINPPSVSSFMAFIFFLMASMVSVRLSSSLCIKLMHSLLL